ncbi:PGF-pre-PGF domain-containing protein [Halosimplex halobium]|uniref:PGF-pre-PGF domain-containing protein n=1 Tax=Halosimplex halobium TaxID=3396618 RepID=UPI003F556225
MVPSGTRQRIQTILVVGFVVLSVLHVPLSAADVFSTQPPADETFEVSDKVDAWERSFLPLRAGTDNAAETIPNADWRVSSSEGDETNLNKDPIAVYEAGTEVSLNFDLSDANGNSNNFANEDVEVLRVHIEETGEGSVPDTFSEALDFVTEENANENASYKEVTASTTLDADGDVSFSDTVPESGHYIYVVAVPESGDGFSVTNTNADGADGDLSIDGETTVVGMEQVAVRKGSGSVSAPDSVRRGNSATFDVDASSLQGEHIQQAIVLYDEDKYVTESFVINITDDVSSDFDIETDSELETTIDEVNGVANVEDSFGMFGMTVGDGQVARSAGIESLVDFVGEEAGPGSPDTVDMSTGTVVLNASMTAINSTNPDTEISVETFANWTTGNYSYAYVAVGENSQEMLAQSGELRVRSARDDDDDDDADDGDGGDGGGGGGGGGGGIGGGGGGGGGGGDGAANVVTPTIFRSGSQASATVGNVNSGTTISLRNIDVTSESGVTLNDLNVTAALDSSDVEAQVSLTENPGEAEELPEAANNIQYIDVQLTNLNGSNISPGTFRFQVSQSRLDELGVSSDEIVLYRFSDGQWETLNTTHVAGDRYKAETPGFSMFAVGTEYASLDVTDVQLSATEVSVGDTVDVSVTIENTGNTEGTESIAVTSNGDEQGSTSVTLAAGESTTETIQVTFDSAGEYDIGAGGVAGDTVVVSQEGTDAPDDGTDAPDDGTDAPDDGTDAPDDGTDAPDDGTDAPDDGTDGPDDGDEPGDETTTTAPGDGGGGNLPLIIVGIVVVLAIIAGVAYYFREQ